MLRDAVVYVWPLTGVEAVVVPGNPVTGEKSRLYYVTRRTRKILLFLVDTQIPGGRFQNLFKTPLILDHFMLHQFVAAFLFTSVFDITDQVEMISVYCSPTSGSAVVCRKDSDIYTVEYREHELKVVWWSN